MNHKRKRAKHQRAGCLLCKPWKDERNGRDAMGEPTAARRGGDRRRLVSALEQMQVR